MVDAGGLSTYGEVFTTKTPTKNVRRAGLPLFTRGTKVMLEVTEIPDFAVVAVQYAGHYRLPLDVKEPPTQILWIPKGWQRLGFENIKGAIFYFDLYSEDPILVTAYKFDDNGEEMAVYDMENQRWELTKVSQPFGVIRFGINFYNEPIRQPKRRKLGWKKR